MLPQGDGNGLPPAFDQRDIEELARSGGLCVECGGLHVGSIDLAVKVLSSHETGAPRIPWCSCGSRCPACAPLSDTVERLQRRESSDRPHYPGGVG